jgi:DNA end-binding protein Ku
MYYANEVRAIPEYGQTKNTEVKPAEIQLAEQLVKSLAAPFDPEKYEDAYQKRLTAMIDAKREGKSVKETKGRKLAPVIDLMAALQRSLNQAGTEKKPASSTHQNENEERQSASPRKRRVAGG